MKHQFPRFVKDLESKGSNHWERGRAAVLDFKTGNRASTKIFLQSKDLRTHLTQRPKHGPFRRLWLVEDVSKNWIEALGSELRIPPSFFAAHWADPSGADFNERCLFDSNPRRRFLLKFPQFHRISTDGVNCNRNDLKGDPKILLDSSVERYIFFTGDEDRTYENPDFARSYHIVSFWSTEYPGGSWDGQCFTPQNQTHLQCVA